MTSPWFQEALELARSAAAAGEVPVGAVIVDPATNQRVAAAYNRTEIDHDPTAHAEILAIREACKKTGSPRLPGFDLYVTLEPCAMCAQAISNARIRRVIFGAYDPKGGGVEHGARLFHQPTCHHKPDVIGGVMELACGQMLEDFFRARRANT